MPARDLLKLITETQIHSEGPFVMNGDSCNIKSNHRHRGYIKSSNLCQEIVEYTDKDEIASCNLASISLKMFCKKPLSSSVYDCKSQEEIAKHLVECYDFKELGNTVKWVVKNLNMVIDNNFYPLDEYDNKTNTITKRGKIAMTNFKSRPLGIGVSGFSDMLARLDLPFCGDDTGRTVNPVVELLNKMIFACIEYNGLEQSHQLATVYGPYETFIYKDKKCPYAEGKFQHDLWAEEYKVLSELRSKSSIAKRQWVRKAEDDLPIEPNMWGQNTTWEDLRQKIVKDGLYNSLITAIMPTATTSQIIGNCESTEAHMNIVYSRETKSGFYIITNEYLCKDLQDIGLLNDDIMNNIRTKWDGSLSGLVEYVKNNYKDFTDYKRLNHIRRKYMTAFELSNRIFMKMAADRGRYIDQSQSLNVFIPKVSTEILSALLYYGYDLGLKTCMYYLYQKKFSQIAQFGSLGKDVDSVKVDSVKTIENKVPVVKDDVNNVVKEPVDKEVVMNKVDVDTTTDELSLTPIEICRRDAETGKKICEMCT
jgi:ribonucleotide reductase alpha subunit